MVVTDSGITTSPVSDVQSAKEYLPIFFRRTASSKLTLVKFVSPLNALSEISATYLFAIESGTFKSRDLRQSIPSPPSPTLAPI